MSNTLLGYIFFSFISPILSLLSGLLARTSRSTKQWLLITFITLYGTVITISEASDGTRHWETVYEHYVDLSFGQFAEETYLLATLQVVDDINEDLYIHFLSYFTGGILGMPQLFFVFVSFIYAYFYSKSLFKVLTFSNKDSLGFLFYGFVFGFILWKSIEGINTVRTWTGAWVLFYSCISYHQTKKLKYALLMFAPAQIHIGFFLMALPAWIVLFAGAKKRLYVIIFGVSFLASQFSLSQSFLNFTSFSEQGAKKAEEYYIEKESSSSEILQEVSYGAWYLKLEKLGYFEYLDAAIALLLISLGIYSNFMTKLEESLFSIGLMTKSLANFFWFIYAVNNRGHIVAGLFIIATLLLFWQRRNFLRDFSKIQYRIFRASLWFILLAFTPFFIYKISNILYFLSAYILFFPFVPWFFEDINISIMDFLKKIF